MAASGCGAGHAHSATSARDSASGHVLFTQACGACHTLSGHNDPRHQGGDLLNFHATRAQMLQLAGEMPVRHPLSQSQLQAIVRFLMAVQSGRS